VVRAVKKQVDARSTLSQPLGDVLVHQADVGDAIEPARDAGLVRQHRDRDTGPVEGGDRLG
jgi:hypothetical protein